MYDFCFLLKHLLVGILFHNLHHPYIPLHSEEMIFPLVPFKLSPTLFALQSEGERLLHAYAPR